MIEKKGLRISDRLRGISNAVASRIDGWSNVFTGLGERFKDKRLGAKIQAILSGEIEVEQLYTADGLARKIIERLPLDGTREWINIEKAGTPETIKKINDDMDRLQVQSKFTEAWTWGRLYGGAFIFPQVDDGLPASQNMLNLEEPLDLNRIREVKNLIIFNRYELTVAGTDITSDLDDTNFGLPTFYRLATSHGSKQTVGKIHHSRLIRFDGKRLPRRLFINNQYYHDSAFTGIREVLADYSLGHGSIATVLQEFRVVVYKVKDLAEAFAATAGGDPDADAEEAIKKRLAALNMSKSVIGAYVMDQEEDIEVKSMTVQGVANLLKAIKERFQSVLDMPHTIIFGDSPSGLGATGRSEERVWFDQVKSTQTTFLSPRVDRMLEIMLAARKGPTGGKMPADFDWKFKALFQLTEMEEADLEKTQAESDQIRIDTGVLVEEEVRDRRFPDAGAKPENDLKNENTALKEEMTRLQRETLAPIVPPVEEATEEEVEEANDRADRAREYTLDAPHVPVDQMDQRAMTDVQSLILSKERFKNVVAARKWVTDNDFRADKVDETEESFRFRQRPPAVFREGSFRTITLTRGVKAVIGRPK